MSVGPACKFDEGCHRVVACDPGCGRREDCGPVEPEQAGQPADRAALSARLWAVAEQHIVAEWICCEPVNPKHPLCAKGQAALGMVRSLLVDADPEQAWNPAAPLLDAVLSDLRSMADGAPVHCPGVDGGTQATESVDYQVVGDWGVDYADSAEKARAAVAKWLRAYPRCGARAEQRVTREWEDGSEFYGPWTPLPEEN